MTGENNFVFVTPAYNVGNNIQQMLYSICGQSYKNWRLIIIDDVSDEKHINKTQEVLLRLSKFDSDSANKISFIKNVEKRWATANVLHGISLCNDDDIVCRIDADDWLTDLDALALINHFYNETKCDTLWTAHRWAFSDMNISGKLPNGVDPYTHQWVSSHMKTFRKKLINNVKDENFRDENGEYFRRAEDQAIFLPILKHSMNRVFLPRVMYHYTIDMTRKDLFTDSAAHHQKDIAQFIRKRGYIQ